jgi:NAD(P)-dependent dehydrogenase (short-subunit alcohol dehydrogenase family)
MTLNRATADLAGTNWLITGGSSGIGLGLGLAAAARGARVALAGTSRSKLDAAESMLAARGATGIGLVLDVADAAAWPSALAVAEERLGPIDHLVLNAGIGTENTPVDSSPLALWRWTFDVNVMGLVHGLHCCLPAMRARGRTGRILITSSIAALVTPAGLGPYSTTKAAAIALAQTLRAELAATSIVPSVLVPAAVRTEFSATSNRHAPAEWDPDERARSLEHVRNMLNGGLDPYNVGHFVVAQMLRGAFYIFTHPDFRAEIAARQAELLTAVPLSASLIAPG